MIKNVTEGEALVQIKQDSEEQLIVGEPQVSILDNENQLESFTRRSLNCVVRTCGKYVLWIDSSIHENRDIDTKYDDETLLILEEVEFFCLQRSSS